MRAQSHQIEATFRVATTPKNSYGKMIYVEIQCKPSYYRKLDLPDVDKDFCSIEEAQAIDPERK